MTIIVCYEVMNDMKTIRVDVGVESVGYHRVGRHFLFTAAASDTFAVAFVVLAQKRVTG